MNQHHVGYLIKSINDKLKIKADEDLRQHKLTLSQSRIVWFLTQKNGMTTQKEIEDFLEVSHPTVVGLVSRMEQNGILSTHFDSTSKSKIVLLTKQAKAFAEEMNNTITESEKTLLAGFSDEEVACLETMLTAILKNLEK